MNINGLLKKRLLFFAISTVFIVFITVASSYAFMHNDLNDDVVVLNNKNLQVLYENEQMTEKNSSYPMNFQQGTSEIADNTIKIINKKGSKTNYYLKITNKDSSENNLSFEKMYYSINDEAPMLLSTTPNGIVYYGQVNGKEEYVLNIKVWPATEYITNVDQGKIINLKYEIIEN